MTFAMTVAGRQIQKRPPGPVRQLSLEIGEEWERVHLLSGLNSHAELPGGEISDVDDVFVWLSSSTTDTIPMTVMKGEKMQFFKHFKKVVCERYRMKKKKVSKQVRKKTITILYLIV